MTYRKVNMRSCNNYPGQKVDHFQQYRSFLLHVPYLDHNSLLSHFCNYQPDFCECALASSFVFMYVSITNTLDCVWTECIHTPYFVFPLNTVKRFIQVQCSWYSTEWIYHSDIEEYWGYWWIFLVLATVNIFVHLFWCT